MTVNHLPFARDGSFANAAVDTVVNFAIGLVVKDFADIAIVSRQSFAAFGIDALGLHRLLPAAVHANHLCHRKSVQRVIGLQIVTETADKIASAARSIQLRGTFVVLD
jgi:hypothetical protein